MTRDHLTSDAPPALLWTVRESAQELRLSERTVFRLIRDGTLPAVRVGRALRLDPRDLARFVEKRKTVLVPEGVCA